MRGRFPGTWRNLVLLYLAIFLTMSAWGTTALILRRQSWPVSSPAGTPARHAPSLREILGIWPPRRTLWPRLLELGIPGLSRSRPRRLAAAPVLPARPGCAWLASCCRPLS
ncbi:MAG: hypothetical protein ACM3XS_04755 [Bacteroidota bacterium]